MRIESPIHGRHARIEIIPLIDIMFFLLASFMMVSLSMTKVENIAVNLPTASVVEADFGADMVNIAVDKAGKMWVQKKEIGQLELYGVLSNAYLRNAKAPVFISGDAETQHGDMVRALELVRNAGIQRVMFTVTQSSDTGKAH
jgi:biopolymer transport protein ExbD